jgi:chromosome segregation ATPase
VWHEPVMRSQRSRPPRGDERWCHQRVRRLTPLLLGLVVLGGAVAVHLGSRSDLRATHDELTASRLERSAAADAATRSEAALASTSETLGEVRASLRTSARRLGRVQEGITARTGERDRLRARLQAVVAELTGTRGEVAAGYQQLGLQGSQIAALDACLNGVSRALLQVAFEDDDGAAASLRAVAGPCASSSAALDGMAAA